MPSTAAVRRTAGNPNPNPHPHPNPNPNPHPHQAALRNLPPPEIALRYYECGGERGGEDDICDATEEPHPSLNPNPKP